MQVGRRNFLIGAALLAVTIKMENASAGLEQTPESPASFPAPKRIRLGAAVQTARLATDPVMRDLLGKGFGSVTPEIELKWNAVQPREGLFAFTPVDDLIGFAADSNMRVHGHALLWGQSTPDWAADRIRSSADRAKRTIEDHFSAVLSRYSKAIAHWDVVNEPIDTQAGNDGLTRNIFFGALGKDYISFALQLAHHHAPAARLMINDYGFEYDNYVERDRRNRFLRLVEELAGKNVPLHGVGLQAHLDLSKGPIDEKSLHGFLGHLQDVGLDIHISELDVKEGDLGLPIRRRDQLVADEVSRYLDVALQYRAVTGVTTWGLSDRDSWLNPQDIRNPDQPAAETRRLNRGLPFDANMQPKPVLAELTRMVARANYAV